MVLSHEEYMAAKLGGRGRFQLTPDSLPVRSMDSGICAMILNRTVPNSFTVIESASANLWNRQSDFLGSLNDQESGMRLKMEVLSHIGTRSNSHFRPTDYVNFGHPALPIS